MATFQVQEGEGPDLGWPTQGRKYEAPKERYVWLEGSWGRTPAD